MVHDRYEQIYPSYASAYTQPNNAYTVQPASPEKPKFIGKLIFSIILSIIPPYLGVVPLSKALDFWVKLWYNEFILQPVPTSLIEKNGFWEYSLCNEQKSIFMGSKKCLQYIYIYMLLG